MKYLDILDCSITDGEGIRVVLFVSGCSHHCEGCQNPESWNPNNGKEVDKKVIDKLIELCSREYIDGLTLSGGDPLYETNRDATLVLVKTFKDNLPNKTIWLYTGYSYDEIKDLEILKYIDVVVDGEFILSERDITLPFRGSRNQNIIKKGEV